MKLHQGRLADTGDGGDDPGIGKMFLFICTRERGATSPGSGLAAAPERAEQRATFLLPLARCLSRTIPGENPGFAWCAEGSVPVGTPLSGTAALRITGRQRTPTAYTATGTWQGVRSSPASRPRQPLSRTAHPRSSRHDAKYVRQHKLVVVRGKAAIRRPAISWDHPG